MVGQTDKPSAAGKVGNWASSTVAKTDDQKVGETAVLRDPKKAVPKAETMVDSTALSLADWWADEKVDETAASRDGRKVGWTAALKD